MPAKNSCFVAVLRGYMTLHGYGQEKLANELAISRTALNNRMNRPECFTLGEIIDIFRILEYNDSDILRVMSNL